MSASGPPAGGRPDPVHAQLAGPRPAHRPVRRHQAPAARAADLCRPRGRARAALSQRRLHPPAAHARAGRAVDARRHARAGRCQRLRLRAGRRAARLRDRSVVHAGAGPGLGALGGDRRPRLPCRCARRHDAGQGRGPRAAARRHGQLRQALSGSRLRARRLAHGAAARRPLAQGHPGRRRGALRLAGQRAGRGDGGARRLPAIRRAGCRPCCAGGWALAARSSPTI